MRFERAVLAVASLIIAAACVGCGGATADQAGEPTGEGDVSESPSVGQSPAPGWLLKRAIVLADGSHVGRAWWTKTTAEQALRAVEPGHWQAPNESNSRPVYLLIMRGAFTPRTYPAGASPAPAPWAFEVIDARTRIVDGAGCGKTPYRMGKLDLHEIDAGSLSPM